MEALLSGHGVYRTEYHIVWIPKYRRRILNPGVKGYLSKLFPRILRRMPGCEIVEMNIQLDHIHLLMVIPPKYAVSEVIGEIKQYTASQLRGRFAWLGKVYWKERVIWSPGYFVSTVGLDEKSITEYVKWQGRQDSGQALLDLKSATGYARGYLQRMSKTLPVLDNFYMAGQWVELGRHAHSCNVWQERRPGYLYARQQTIRNKDSLTLNSEGLSLGRTLTKQRTKFPA